MSGAISAAEETQAPSGEGASRPRISGTLASIGAALLDPLIESALNRINDALRFLQRVDAHIGAHELQLDLEAAQALVQGVDRIGELLLRFLQGFYILDDLQMLGELLRRLGDLVTSQHASTKLQRQNG
ncbi:MULTISPECIES: hypothetical protein [Methylosinus]|uniref:Uncharacterized protein n=1 Tax=Methylosinus trichosporium (strain ATCC 35070 / NCIMB 11131 / UNIQEM 75 / OB3b) TaxID=595536 RepID=A0A2D2D0B3_METT3|nr:MULTISPECIES: hypothetical protein [Methylosinus]ATQ68309.1 hypothetical protein CQW49_10785 [Methylosinus trichosporium OB3b]OBS50952.1 hypothetical protein A8B73_18875 [Methylosinus sp. 3S-1]